MLKFLKRISSFLILIIISLILIPNNVFALSTGYKNINEVILAINDDNSSVRFSNVSFGNWSDSINPSLYEIALITVVLFIVIAPSYFLDLFVGIDPSSV